MDNQKRDLSKTQRLVQNVQRGNTRSFNALYSLYFEYVYYVAYKILRDENAAVEATYETFEKAHARINTLENPAAFQKWIATISHNTCMDLLRKTERRKETHFGEYAETHVDGLLEEGKDYLPEEYLQQEEVKEALAQLVGELPRAQREAVLMHYFQGLSGVEIAEITQASPDAVHKRLSKARAALRSRIEGLTESPNAERLAGVLTAGPALSVALQSEAHKVATAAAKEAAHSLLVVSGTASAKAGGVSALSGTAGKSLIAKVAAGVLLGSAAVGGAVAIASNYTKAPDPPVAVPTVSEKAPKTTAPFEVVPAAAEESTEETAPASVATSSGSAPEVTSVKKTTKTAAPKKEASPSIVLTRSELTYPVGTVVPLSQILEDSYAFAIDASGDEIRVSVSGYELIDFSRPGSYLLWLNATDNKGRAAATELLSVQVE